MPMVMSTVTNKEDDPIAMEVDAMWENGEDKEEDSSDESFWRTMRSFSSWRPTMKM